MSKKRSIGVALLGWYFVIMGIASFFFQAHHLRKTLAPDFFSWAMLFCGFALSALNFFIGINILHWRELWRKLAFGYCLFIVLSSVAFVCLSKHISKTDLIGIAVTCVLYGFFFYYLKRPGIRDQFS
jgi:peptidoglycan/LPS O-acetylase OafA/YrhL